MNDLDKARDDLLEAIAAALVQLNVGEQNERDLCDKLGAFKEARKSDVQPHGLTGYDETIHECRECLKRWEKGCKGCRLA